VFVDRARLERGEAGRSLLGRLDPGAIVEVGESALAAIADTRTPQGVAAVFPIELAEVATGRIVLVLDGLQDPGNVGTAIRSAAASGLVETVVVRGGADPFGPKAVRAAAAAVFAVRVARPSDAELPRLLAGRDVWLAEADADRAYDAVDWNRASALVVGSEARGPSDELRALATGSVSVPLTGPVESLNAAVAASIILFHAQLKSPA
jgi:TrmH family RNA methyltransferase